MSTCVNCKRDGVEFYAINKSWCKECIRERARKSRLARIDEVREYDRVRGRTKAKRAKVRQYARTPEGKAARARASKAWRDRNREKYLAHTAVGNALRDGRLVRQPCEHCGSLKVEANHDDYAKPLEVRWLCDKHHKHHHREKRST